MVICVFCSKTFKTAKEIKSCASELINRKVADFFELIF